MDDELDNLGSNGSNDDLGDNASMNGGNQQDAGAILSGAAEVIGASGGIIALFAPNGNTGTAPVQSNIPTVPREEPKTNWLLIGGIAAGFLFIVALLIYANKNGKTSKK